MLGILLLPHFSHVFYKNVLDVQLLLVNFASGAHFFDNSDHNFRECESTLFKKLINNLQLAKLE